MVEPVVATGPVPWLSDETDDATVRAVWDAELDAFAGADLMTRESQ
jgi:hypothetical protein